MKLLRFIINAMMNVFFSSADPNLFGSSDKQDAYAKESKKMKGYASDVQGEIDLLKTENPFESAAAKQAMATSSRKAKQMSNKFANMMGGSTNPEALVAAQGASQEAIGATAGDIAVGAEAMKKQEVSQLRGLKAGYQSQASQLRQAEIAEFGSEWDSIYSAMNPLGSMIGGGLEA